MQESQDHDRLIRIDENVKNIGSKIEEIETRREARDLLIDARQEKMGVRIGIVEGLVSEARGSWKTLTAVGGLSGTVGAFVHKIFG